MNPLLPAIKTLKPSLLPVETQNDPSGKLITSKGHLPFYSPVKNNDSTKINADNPDNWDDRWFADYE